VEEGEHVHTGKVLQGTGQKFLDLTQGTADAFGIDKDAYTGQFGSTL
jgi:hypothetical protein